MCSVSAPEENNGYYTSLQGVIILTYRSRMVCDVSGNTEITAPVKHDDVLYLL